MRKNTFANGKQENLLFSYKVSHENIFLKKHFYFLVQMEQEKLKHFSIPALLKSSFLKLILKLNLF